MAGRGGGVALRCVGLVKRYEDVVAVAGLDLEVRTGECFGLLGPNGAGKTTTIEICEGLLAPTDGTVRVLDMDWTHDATQLRSRIGVTLQETRLFAKQTVRELLALFVALYDDARSADELLAIVALEEKAGARYQHLSGGQKQRLAVAAALAGRPDLLFLDEPTTGLDPQSRRSLWDVIRRFRDDDGGTVVLTTHYMDEAEALCDRVGIVDHGKLIALGSPRELVSSLGAAHVVEVDADGIDAAFDTAALEALPGVVEHACTTERLTLTVRQPHVAVPAVLRAVEAKSLRLRGLSTRHLALEDVFVHLTGRHLRDGEAE
ncbi:MAG: ABC transporter ATP-binding protein [Planctomycetes bacterium]|nr:ABC transporter ATP-binding protein [Planctomycetota bacterium]